MQCDMCGKEGMLVEALIENTKMNVCRQCSRFGKVLREIQVETKPKKKEKLKHETQKTQEPEAVEELVSDFGQRIRKARERLGLNQKDFALKISEKESAVHKMETGEIKPSIENAKKLERILKIKLVAEYKEEQKQFRPEDESKEMTLGDFFKKKE